MSVLLIPISELIALDSLPVLREKTIVIFRKIIHLLLKEISKINQMNYTIKMPLH